MLDEATRWRTLVKRMTLTPNTRIGVGCDAYHTEPRLQVIAEVPDSRNPNKTISVVSSYTLPLLSEREWDEEYAVAWIRQCLARWVMHEIDEWLRLDGKLLNDPHATDAIRTTA